jgi:hypothetical protein
MLHPDSNTVLVFPESSGSRSVLVGILFTEEADNQGGDEEGDNLDDFHHGV